MREKKSETTLYVIEREFLSRCTSEEMLRRLIRTHLQKPDKSDETCENESKNIASCGTIAAETAARR